MLKVITALGSSLLRHGGTAAHSLGPGLEAGELGLNIGPCFSLALGFISDPYLLSKLKNDHTWHPSKTHNLKPKEPLTNAVILP